jgi:hypothetical protein
MSKLLINIKLMTALALLAIQPSAAGQATKDAAEGRGPYEGVAGLDNSVWVVDTRSGRVSRCIQDFAEQPPKCSAFSKGPGSE